MTANINIKAVVLGPYEILMVQLFKTQNPGIMRVIDVSITCLCITSLSFCLRFFGVTRLVKAAVGLPMINIGQHNKRVY